MIDKRQFVAVAQKLVRGVLREAIGYSVEFDIPYYQGTVGFMLEAPMLWIRHSRFPIIFIAYDCRRSDTLDAIVMKLDVRLTRSGVSYVIRSTGTILLSSIA